MAVAATAALFGAGALCFLLIQLPHFPLTYKTAPYIIIMNINDECIYCYYSSMSSFFVTWGNFGCVFSDILVPVAR